MADTAAGNGWLKSGIVEVELPSGWRVRGVLPMLRTLLRLDLVTPQLLEVAVKGADPEWLTEAAQDPERREHLRRYTDTLVATFPREASADGETWEPVTLTIEDLPNMDQRDVDLIEDLVLRLKTPDQVTQQARALRGEPLAETTEASADELATFLDDASGDEGGADGAGVVDTPEPAAASGG